MANIVNLDPPLPQGDDYSITATLYIADGITPFDLTNNQGVYFTVKQFDSGPNLVARDLASGISIVNAVAGVIKIVGAKADTLALAPRPDYRYDIVAIDSNAKRKTYVIGRFPIASHPRSS